MVNRAKSAKGPSDLTDIRRLLLTFPELKASEGPVAACLRAAGAGRAGTPCLAGDRLPGDRAGERRRRVLNSGANLCLLTAAHSLRRLLSVCGLVLFRAGGAWRLVNGHTRRPLSCSRSENIEPVSL